MIMVLWLTHQQERTTKRQNLEFEIQNFKKKMTTDDEIPKGA